MLAYSSGLLPDSERLRERRRDELIAFKARCAKIRKIIAPHVYIALRGQHSRGCRINSSYHNFSPDLLYYL
jgi:hypothetical protein